MLTKEIFEDLITGLLTKKPKTILATREDEEIFVNALLNPKKPNETLKKAFTKYRHKNKL